MDEPDKGQCALTQSDIDQRRVTLFLQPHFRAAATHAGLFRTCRLPQCRRAKRCCGCHPRAEIGTSPDKRFPPCVRDNQSQAAMLCAADDLCERHHQSLLASGRSAEDIERETDALEKEFYEGNDFLPEPSLPPVKQKPRGR